MEKTKYIIKDLVMEDDRAVEILYDSFKQLEITLTDQIKRNEMELKGIKDDINQILKEPKKFIAGLQVHINQKKIDNETLKEHLQLPKQFLAKFKEAYPIKNTELENQWGRKLEYIKEEQLQINNNKKTNLQDKLNQLKKLKTQIKHEIQAYERHIKLQGSKNGK